MIAGFFFLVALFQGNAFALLGAADTAVVHDPINGATAQLGVANARLFHTFMQLQMVQDALMIKNNILEAESYYTYIDNASKHRGGLVGFYKDMALAEINQIVAADKNMLEQQATTITGPTAVDDFMAAATAGAIRVTQQAASAADSAAAGGVSSFNVAYNDATGGAVANSNSVVRTWQQQQNIQTSQLAKQVALSSSVASAIAASNAYVAKLDTSLNSLAGTASLGSLTDQQHEQIIASYAAINAKLLVELHRLLNIQATLLKTQLDSQSATSALAQQTATDLSTYKSQNAALRRQYGAPAGTITAQMQK
jgi:hypothetical protein